MNIYANINLLFSYFEYGGTYFGHQSKRILAYAEFSIYSLVENRGLEKTYNILKQKNLYITSLRQLIEDESQIDTNTLGKDKVIRKEKLNKIVDNIDRLITDIFYLRKAQEFQYSNY